MNGTSKFSLLLAGGLLACVAAYHQPSFRALPPVRAAVAAASETAAKVRTSLQHEVSTILPGRAASAHVAVPAVPPQLQVPAIRRGTYYGWIQLPRGTAVDLLREQGDRVRVRYEESVMEVPRQAIKEGIVSLRNGAARITRTPADA